MALRSGFLGLCLMAGFACEAQAQWHHVPVPRYYPAPHYRPTPYPGVPYYAPAPVVTVMPHAPVVEVPSAPMPSAEWGAVCATPAGECGTGRQLPLGSGCSCRIPGSGRRAGIVQ